jgi:hypothetical protein
MAVKDYSELVDNLFKSVDVIVAKQLEALPYDRTIKCSIVNTDNAEKGEYIVSDGASSYKAYSENTDYQEGIYVYVNIPNGDFNEQKMIVGKCTSDDTEYFTYVSPMETYIDITHNLIEEGSQEASLLANGDRAGITIWSAKDLNLKDYDRLGIKANFKAWLNSMNCISGSYGLRVDIRVVENNTTQETNKYKYYSFNLDSESDMYGSPYNFETFYNQEKVVDISGLGTIDTMRVVFYQNSDFYNGDKELIPNYDSDLKMDLPDNLFIQDAYISVGYDLSDFTEDTLMLFTLDSETYGTDLTTLQNRIQKKIEENKKEEEETEDELESIDEEATEDNEIEYEFLTKEENEFLKLDLNNPEEVNKYLTENVNRKTLQLRWIHLDENTEVFKSLETIPESDYPENETNGITQKGIIHWYRYKLANGVEDELAGAFYQEMEEAKNKFSILFDPDITEQYERVKAILEYPSREYVEFLKSIDETLLRYGSMRQGNELFLYNLCKEGATTLDEIVGDSNDTELKKLKEKVSSLLAAINGLSEGQRILDLGSDNILLLVDIMNQVCTSEDIANDLLKNLGFGKQDGSNASVINRDKINSSAQNLKDQQNTEVADLNTYYDNLIAAGNNLSGEKAKKLNDLNNQHDAELKIAEVYVESSKSYNYLVGVDLYFIGKPYTTEEMNNAITEYESKEAELDGMVNYYESDVLILTNEQKVADKATIDLIRGLAIECDTAGYNGNYKIYDDTGKIMSSSEGSKLRTLTATYTSLISGEDELDTAEQITWYIPTENTMIYPPTLGYEYDYYKMVNVADEDEFKAYPEQLYTKTINGVLLSSKDDEDSKYAKVEKSDSYSPLTRYYVQLDEKDLIISEENGYFKITRRGTEKVGKKPGLEEADSTEQLFRIKTQYSQSAINNTIKCEVIKNNVTYSAETTLTFGPHGTNGTDYTFTLEFEDKSLALTHGKSVTVVPKVYDNENNDITSTFTDGFDFSWYSEGNGGLKMETSSGNNCVISTVDGASISNCRYYILKAKTNQLVQSVTKKDTTGVDEEGNEITETSTVNVRLSTILPIAVRSSDDFITFDGTTEIAYDSSGVNPSYYKNKYQLYKYEEGRSTPYSENVYWRTFSGDSNFDERYYPQVSIDGIITVPSMYIQGNDVRFSIDATEGGSAENILWTQPIYIHQNTYSSLMLNSWDGSLTFDEDNGTILSAMIGAGEKNEQNQFNGVLMGKASLADSSASKIGLYGYHEGAQSFGFLIDGTAFLGKSGKGRIKIDGNEGYIQSQNYESNSEGMKIDLNTGILISKGPKFSETISFSWDEESGKEIEKTSQAMIKIDPTPSADENDNTYGNPYFLVQSCNGNKLINISSTNMYIQTDDFCSTSGSEAGVRFDLSRSKLTGYNFEFFTKETEGEYAGSYVKIASDGNPYLEVYQKYTEDNKVLRDLKLMYIGKKEFIIQSQNWQQETTDKNGSGVQLSLTGGKITAYDFSIKAIQSTGNYAGSYIQMDSSGSPFFKIYYKNSGQSYYKWDSSTWSSDKTYYYIDENGDFVQANESKGDVAYYILKETTAATVDLVNITTNNFTLKSQNWSSSYKTGTCLNMKTGILKSYDFKIDASGRTFTVTENNETKTEEGYIIIDSGASQYPLKIGPYFKISWSGRISASYIAATTGGQIGPFYFDSDKLWTNSASLGGLGVYLGKSGFSVSDTSGTPDLLIRTAPNNNQYTLLVNGTSNLAGTTKISGSLTVTGDMDLKGKITGNSWSVTKEGLATFNNINATAGTIGPWSLSSSGLSMKGGTSLTSSQLTIGSDVTLSSTGLTIGSDITLNSNGLTIGSDSISIGGGVVQAPNLLTPAGGEVGASKLTVYSGGTLAASGALSCALPDKANVTFNGKTLGALAFLDDLKKKFNITMKGTFKGDYYTKSDSQKTYYTKGASITRYTGMTQKSISIKCTYIGEDYCTIVENGYSHNLKVGESFSTNTPAYTYSSATTVNIIGTEKTVDVYDLISSTGLKIEGTGSQEVTLDGSENASGDISLEITGVEFKKQS